MICHIKRYFAIRSYMMRLSGELVRRFGRKAGYKVEHVTQAIQRGGFPPAFAVYAHAAYCSREDFDAHYEPTGLPINYFDLRRPIARRYFSNHLDFDAQTICAKYASSDDSGSFYESGIGITGSDAGH